MNLKWNPNKTALVKKRRREDVINFLVSLIVNETKYAHPVLGVQFLTPNTASLPSIFYTGTSGQDNPKTLPFEAHQFPVIRAASPGRNAVFQLTAVLMFLRIP